MTVQGSTFSHLNGLSSWELSESVNQNPTWHAAVARELANVDHLAVALKCKAKAEHLQGHGGPCPPRHHQCWA